MKKNKKFSSTIDQLSVHYDLLVRKFGDDVKSSQQSNNETRENNNYLSGCLFFLK